MLLRLFTNIIMIRDPQYHLDGAQAQEKRVEDERRSADLAAEQHKCREAELRER